MTTLLLFGSSHLPIDISDLGFHYIYGLEADDSILSLIASGVTCSSPRECWAFASEIQSDRKRVNLFLSLKLNDISVEA
jgi:hypothetical protein